MMFGEMPDHIRKRKQRDIPDIDSLDAMVLPSAPLMGAVLEPLRTETRAAVLDNSSLMEDITNKALARLDEILSEPMADEPKGMAVQMDAVRLALTTQLRVDDSRLKRRSVDTLANLLARMSEEEAKLPKLERSPA